MHMLFAAFLVMALNLEPADVAKYRLADAQHLRLSAQLQDVATDDPCVILSITNTSSEDIVFPLDDLDGPWLHFTLFMSKNGSPVKNGFLYYAPDNESINTVPLHPGVTFPTDVTVSDAYHRHCIALSRWGVGKLSTGTYTLRFASNWFDDPRSLNRIEETRGLRTDLVTFSVP